MTLFLGTAPSPADSGQRDVLIRIAGLACRGQRGNAEQLAADLGLTPAEVGDHLLALHRQNLIVYMRGMPVSLSDRGRGWAAKALVEQVTDCLTFRDLPRRVTLSRGEDGDVRVLFRMADFELLSEHILDLTWEDVVVRAGTPQSLTFTEDEFQNEVRRLSALTLCTDFRSPGNRTHDCDHSLYLIGFPEFLTRLVDRLAPELRAIPGLYLDTEEGWIELPPFGYGLKVLLRMIPSLASDHGLEIADEQEHRTLLREWVALAGQHIPQQTAHIHGHRRLSYGPSRTSPGKHLLIRGPYDPTWLTLARQIPGRRWSGADDAHVIPVSSYAAVLAVLKSVPHYNLLSPQDVEEIGRWNATAVRRSG